MELDLEALSRMVRHAYALPPDFEPRTTVHVDGATWEAILERLTELERLLAEARWATTWRTEWRDVALERAERVEAAAREHIAAIEGVTKPGEQVSPTAAALHAVLAREENGRLREAGAQAAEDEVCRLRGLLLLAGTALLAAKHGAPVDDAVLNDIEAALPQGDEATS